MSSVTAQASKSTRPTVSLNQPITMSPLSMRASGLLKPIEIQPFSAAVMVNEAASGAAVPPAMITEPRGTMKQRMTCWPAASQSQ